MLRQNKLIVIFNFNQNYNIVFERKLRIGNLYIKGGPILMNDFNCE